MQSMEFLHIHQGSKIKFYLIPKCIHFIEGMITDNKILQTMYILHDLNKTIIHK